MHIRKNINVINNIYQLQPLSLSLSLSHCQSNPISLSSQLRSSQSNDRLSYVFLAYLLQLSTLIKPMSLANLYWVLIRTLFNNYPIFF